MEHAERWLAAAAFGAVSLVAGTAGAYCRTTTCSASTASPDCDPNALNTAGCPADGDDLYWPTRCIGFGVQKDGSALRNISYQTFHGIVAAAFSQWQGTACAAGGRPSFKMYDLGAVDCHEPEYNSCVPNSNTWMFRDGDWPYVGAAATLALTTVTFSTATGSSGEILDADVEVNSYATPITTTPTTVGAQADLQSIVTHESGHFLGLAHSRDPQATMYYAYSPGDLSFRSLSSDDQAAICDVYPPNPSPATCQDARIVNGFSASCGHALEESERAAGKCPAPSAATTSGGCAVRPLGERSSPWSALAFSALVLGGGLRARRRTRR